MVSCSEHLQTHQSSSSTVVLQWGPRSPWSSARNPHVFSMGFSSYHFHNFFNMFHIFPIFPMCFMSAPRVHASSIQFQWMHDSQTKNYPKPSKNIQKYPNNSKDIQKHPKTIKNIQKPSSFHYNQLENQFPSKNLQSHSQKRLCAAAGHQIVSCINLHIKRFADETVLLPLPPLVRQSIKGSKMIQHVSKKFGLKVQTKQLCASWPNPYKCRTSSSTHPYQTAPTNIASICIHFDLFCLATWCFGKRRKGPTHAPSDPLSKISQMPRAHRNSPPLRTTSTAVQKNNMDVGRPRTRPTVTKPKFKLQNWMDLHRNIMIWYNMKIIEKYWKYMKYIEIIWNIWMMWEFCIFFKYTDFDTAYEIQTCTWTRKPYTRVQSNKIKQIYLLPYCIYLHLIASFYLQLY